MSAGNGSNGAANGTAKHGNSTRAPARGPICRIKYAMLRAHGWSRVRAVRAAGSQAETDSGAWASAKKIETPAVLAEIEAHRGGLVDALDQLVRLGVSTAVDILGNPDATREERSDAMAVARSAMPKRRDVTMTHAGGVGVTSGKPIEELIAEFEKRKRKQFEEKPKA